MIARVRESYPSASLFAATLRQVEDANTHMWGGLMLDGDDWHEILPRRIGVLDRIGGGDGFVGGLLYGITRGFEGEKLLSFAWATGALATTFATDYAQPCDEEQILAIAEGNARVKR